MYVQSRDTARNKRKPRQKRKHQPKVLSGLEEELRRIEEQQSNECIDG